MTISTYTPDAISAPHVSLAQACMFGLAFWWLLHELDSRFSRRSPGNRPHIIVKPDPKDKGIGGVFIDDWTGLRAVVDGTFNGK
jgi:hypothetical protein